MKRAGFLANPYGTTRQDGLRMHDRSWSELYSKVDPVEEFRAIHGIINAAFWGAIAWAVLACFVVILWGIMS